MVAERKRSGMMAMNDGSNNRCQIDFSPLLIETFVQFPFSPCNPSADSV